MNTRIACLAGLAAVAAVLTGCVAQYGNPRACEQEMRQRLADASQGNNLSVTHRAVAFRGRRVVIEGSLDKMPAAASEALAASAPEASSDVKPAVAAAKPEAKPGTPVAAIEQKLGIKKTQRTATAAECTFDESGLRSFQWLSPEALAKTRSDPQAEEN